MPEVAVIRLGKLAPPLPKPSFIRQAVGKFRKPPPAPVETVLQRQSPKIEPSRQIDRGQLAGEAILPGEGQPQTPEQQKGRELSGAGKDNWEAGLGSLVETTGVQEHKDAVRGVRDQVEQFGTEVNEDGEVTRNSRQEKVRYERAKELVKQVEDVLEGRSVITDENSDVYIAVSGVILSGGGDLARQLRDAPDAARVGIIQKMMRSGQYRESVREGLDPIRTEQNPNEGLTQAGQAVEEKADAVRRKEIESGAKQKRIRELKKRLADYEAGKSSKPDGKFYKELTDLQAEVKKLQEGFDQLGMDIEDSRALLEPSTANAIDSGLRFDINKLPQDQADAAIKYYGLLGKQGQAERMLELKQKRLNEKVAPKKQIEKDIEDTQKSIDDERANEQIADYEKSKAERKLERAKDRKKNYEQETVEDLEGVLTNAVSGYVNKRLAQLREPINRTLAEMAANETRVHQKNLETALQYRYEQRVQIEKTVNGKTETTIVIQANQVVASEDYAVLTTQQDVNTGGDMLVRHVLETSPQYQFQSLDANGERVMVTDTPEIDKLMKDQQFLEEMRPLAVKLTLEQRLLTEGMTQSEMLDTLRTTWGQEFSQASAGDPQLKPILDKFGIKAEPGTQEFQEQLENAITNSEPVTDPTDPDKQNQVRLGGLIFASLLIPFASAGLLQSISGEGEGGTPGTH